MYQNDELEGYSNMGLQVMDTFTKDDFLSNPQTHASLERDFFERMCRRLEKEVSDFYGELRAHEDDVASGMFAYDKGGEGIALLMSIIADNVKKDYRYEIFYETPELAMPLLIEYEIVAGQQVKPY
jgi:hypothetical protein